MGTSPSMTIEENLAIAYRRGKRRSLRWGISRKERELYHAQLQTLGLGLETRMSAVAGTLSGGQRQALTLLMATIRKPHILLLDEHTAALDPKTAKTVLELTNKVVRENELTTLMVTHNMRDALKSGNRIMMMHEGNIILDVKGEEKSNLTVPDLLKMFESASGEEMASDRMLLT
jgi:putative ABC transport system ATP-binding protein